MAAFPLAIIAMIMPCMDTNQAKVIELLREVHLLAFKEIERLILRIAELENQPRQFLETPIIKRSQAPASSKNQPEAEVLNEKQVAAYLAVTVSSLRRWRLFRKGPRFLKVGSLVRYKRVDVEEWFNACAVSR
jgi:predicted DNA-binding transcriptional regulator AlpA